MSTIETNTVKPISGSSTLTLGESGDTVNLGTGVTAGTGLGGDLSFGGDTFGEDKVIGSNDNYSLGIETNGSERIRFRNDGKIRIGGEYNDTTKGTVLISSADSGATADSNASELVIEDGTSSGDAGINILSATNGTGRVSFGDSGDNDVGFMRYDHSNGRMWFINNGGNNTYAHAFDSNVTSTSNFRLQIFSDGAENSRHRMIGFDNSSQGRGYIESGDGDSSSPQFAAGSDRRLKENITTYTGGYDKIKAIPVKQWDERYSSKNKGVKGWIADELETVFPDAVSGTANATRNVTNAILDKDGRLVEENTTEARLTKMQSIGKMPNCTFAASATVPVYQYSSPMAFYPDVVQALQKAIEKIETLEAKVAALESA